MELRLCSTISWCCVLQAQGSGGCVYLYSFMAAFSCGLQVCHSNHALFDQRLAKPLFSAVVADSPVPNGNATKGLPQCTERKPNVKCEENWEASLADGVCDPSSSGARLSSLQQAIRGAMMRGRLSGERGLDVPAAMGILSRCPPAHATWAPTLATVVMDPGGNEGSRGILGDTNNCGYSAERSEMHARFRSESAWVTIKVAK